MKFHSAIVLASALLVNGMAVERATVEECRVVDIKIAILLEENPVVADDFCSSYLSLGPSSATDISDSTIFVTTTITTAVATTTISAAIVTTTETSITTFSGCGIDGPLAKRALEYPRDPKHRHAHGHLPGHKPHPQAVNYGQGYGYGAYGAATTVAPTTTTTTTTATTTSLSGVETLSSALADFFPADISLGCDCQLNPPDATTTDLLTIFDSFTTLTITEFVSGTASVTDGGQTVTHTATSVVVEEACPTPSSCGNRGVEWAEYHNDQGYNGDPSYYQFDPAVYKTATPNATGTTSKINVDSTFANTGDTFPVPVYDIEVPVELFVLNHRGYFYAPTTGVYTFYMPQVDDAGFVWVGSKAYSGWTRDNADINFITSLPFDQQKTSVNIQLVAGQFLPVRILFVQAQGGVVLQLQVTGPDHNQYVNWFTDSPFLVSYPCADPSLAFPPWGQET
ncbi:hypothetical protein PFICI_08084 [Pestalotiopsis fici W106-1]|uniref:PA14 domain-containing protein n=1 Tax=Pestalotiopsis fici (strain W106-1 / CGMCC3.15140) TaxID=1229662 RepID=W3X397_PESFW|nr:uncharacterized protein PFICI_08084 [Pestalotiopsis fici W106-1]ETS80555.1 hypothetical protein PFICI_08084 [Pestalotiopsis fici W106-1]